jgi:hypothetical protein
MATVDKAKSTDTVSSGLVAGTRSSENALALGQFTFECIGADGKVKWTGSVPNLVVNAGLAYMAGSALTSVTQITTWYIGLYGAGASNTPAAADTMSSHAGWTEVVPYSNATRVSATFVTATTANPSVATNSASPSAFTINATSTVGGAFLTSGSAKSGTTGTLFSASDFTSPGDRAVVSGDTLNVTYTLSLAG